MKSTSIRTTRKLEKIVLSEMPDLESFTFEPDRSDEKDFPFTNLSKWTIYKMLIGAYELGRSEKK